MFIGPVTWGTRLQHKLFLHNGVFRGTFGSWTSAPKTVDVCIEKRIFLWPWWWVETFWPLHSRGHGRECPQEIRTKRFVYVVFVMKRILSDFKGQKVLSFLGMGDRFITTTGADASGGRSTGKNQSVLVIIFLENTRDFPEITTSTGAEFSCTFCPSVLVLVIFQAPRWSSS